MKTDLYSDITNAIVAKLKAGVIPWRQPWSGKAGSGSPMPRNHATGRAYSGVNVLLLWMAQQEAGYSSAAWLTFKQAIDLGGNVRKGERGTKVVYVGTFEKEDEATGEDVVIPFLKSYTVFNVAQCEGIAIEAAPIAAPRHAGQRDELADEFVASTGAFITHGEGRAYWSRQQDRINVPAFETFKSADSYYATLFHELTHWTGHEPRLNREFGKRFGDRAYSVEELVAELGAAFLSAEFGMDNTDEAASYIDHWIRLLEQDNRLFMAAASAASKSCEYLRELALAAPAIAA